MMLVGAGLVVFGIAGFIILSGQTSGQNVRAELAATPAQVNFAAPKLALQDLQGNPVSLSDLLGQVVLVNNWATWCPPCKEEMPVLQAYYEAHRQQGFTLVAIEAGEAVTEVAEFAINYGLTFPVWPDPEQKALAAFKQLTLPSSYVIDRSGIVRLAWVGPIDQASLEQHVTPLIEE
jgi:peroxiredoxin